MAEEMKAPKDLEKYASFFTDDKFWHKLARAFKKAGVKVVYAALVLFYSLQDPRISKRDKLLIIGALGYFILPVDLIPDFLPALGYTDDLAALVLAFIKVKQCITQEVKAKAEAKLRQWFGDYDKNEIVLEPEDYEIHQNDAE
jgi:uncharacterized membrane protein YkvA (DUF1232 family)